MYDHILIIGFGGPEKAEDVKPFIRKVAQGRKIPEDRLEAVAHHYELIGNRSPYNDHVYRLQKDLAQALKESDHPLPVFVGMRNWHPFLESTFLEIRQQGFKKGIGIILSPFRSEASCQRYKQNVRDAMVPLQAQIQYDYLEPWCEEEGFIQAQADQLRQELEQSPDAEVIFTAHSIPEEMNEGCEHCSYEAEFHRSSELVANKARAKNWRCVYQSRSGNPRQPWLGPDICEVLEEMPEEKPVISLPIGFLCENAEILYDLDIEAKAVAEKRQIPFRRAQTVMGHPQLTRLFHEKILRFLKAF